MYRVMYFNLIKWKVDKTFFFFDTENPGKLNLKKLNYESKDIQNILSICP